MTRRLGPLGRAPHMGFYVAAPCMAAGCPGRRVQREVLWRWSIPREPEEAVWPWKSHSITSTIFYWSEQSETHSDSGEGTRTLLFDERNVDKSATLRKKKKNNCNSPPVKQKTYTHIFPQILLTLLRLKGNFKVYPQRDMMSHSSFSQAEILFST